MKFKLLAAALWCATTLLPESSYEAEIRKWREEREAKLKADDGWLTVVGLSWLKEGEHRFGTDSSNEIVLPVGSTAARAGVIAFRDKQATIRIEPGVNATTKGRPIRTQQLRPDTAGEPDIVSFGDVTIHIIERGGRFGVRVKDKNSSFRRQFTGTRWFPVQERYRIKAKFVRHPVPRLIRIPNVLGRVEDQPSPGYAAFRVDGKQCRLHPVTEAPGQLFFIFRDLTAGKETYAAGRFLDVEAPQGDTIVLDFNTAYAPPCAFTPYATCPLPPPQNRLPVQIPAGEMDYHAPGAGKHPTTR